MTPNSKGDTPPAGRAFVLHQVLDRQHGGAVASVFEYPAGWEARSEIAWDMRNISVPVTGWAQAFDRTSGAGIDFLPQDQFFWLQQAAGYYQQGQAVWGQVFLPPAPAADALTRWVIPRYRGRLPGLRVVGVGAVPDLAQRLGVAAQGAPPEGAAARLDYTADGKPVEEEIYTLKFTVPVPYSGPQGVWTQINWGLRPIAFRAAKGGLDALRDAFWHVARSAKINPAWEQFYGQVMQQIQAQFNAYIQQGYSQIQAAGQMSRAISANNDAMLQTFQHQRQAAAHSGPAPQGRSSTDRFDDYIRGVDTMQDPQYGESQHDYTYNYHWTDGSGNYQHSNDAFFNPNIGSNQSWTLMEPKP